jgi:hypothetical protein
VPDAFEIVSQEEQPGCWIFLVRRESPEGIRDHRLRLAWPDYDLLSPGGDAPPERVAIAVARFLAERPEFAPLAERLDASWARRRVPDADRQIAERL